MEYIEADGHKWESTETGSRCINCSRRYEHYMSFKLANTDQKYLTCEHAEKKS